MKSLCVYVVLCCTILFTSCNAPQQAGEMVDQTSDQQFSIKKGTNIAHWLSQSSRRGVERVDFFTKQDVEYLASLGLDHLRIPIDEEQMWDEQGNKHEDAFALLHNALQWCQESGLKAVVDLHILRSHHFNADDRKLWTDTVSQQQFIDFWRQLSGELSKYPTSMVAYELMNEPVADDPEDWNKLIEKAIAAVRELEPNRTLVIGSNRWQSVDTFDQLKIPENDKNILLSFHFYSPFLLTHYEASWTNIKDYHGPIQYPGQIIPESAMDQVKQLSEELQNRITRQIKVYTKDSLESMFRKPLEFAQQSGLPLYCGEWGAVSNAPEADRLRWYQDMRELFDKHHIAYANWNYESNNFGLVDNEGKNEELIKIVAGENVQ